MMRDAVSVSTVYAKDYEAPTYLVSSVALDFTLHPTRTLVKSELTCVRNPARSDAPTTLWLDGEQLVLVELRIDGEPLAPNRYQVHETGLLLRDLPERFTLTIVVEINPTANTALEGLYVSHGMFCTQCEAQGFRRITYYPDRPDVLSIFSTTIRASQKEYPLLLSNGNLVDSGTDGELHWVKWEDPFPKPCYLFALVGGDLVVKEDHFVTASGRDVALRIYAEARDLDKLDHAMLSLQNAMRWDEDAYGREYDLDLFMIVAVSHFNMGAMENKGLNIFNTSCVLAHPKTTTDAGFQRVEAVVAHEYFHNWSGNRVTCRDWFQLSLKEGFTVHREHHFSADMNDATVKRVEDVDFLRGYQFPEDQGPMAHPVRPASYQKIDNFYTTTIYEKGAEVVRMQRELVGDDTFRRATDDYFTRFDGQAVTCDDFVACVERAGKLDLTQFKRWYSQAGTPNVYAEGRYEKGVYHLKLSQETPATPGQDSKEPFVIPVAMSLIGAKKMLPLNAAGDTEMVLLLDETEKEFTFHVDEPPVPSLLRRFSAPVELHHNLSTDELTRLVLVDTDGYVRWDALQNLYTAQLEAMLAGQTNAHQAVAALTPILEAIIRGYKKSPAETALFLTLPSASILGDRQKVWTPDAVQDTREALKSAIAEQFTIPLWALATNNTTPGDYQPIASDIGKRSLKWCALSYLATTGKPEVVSFLQNVLSTANNMTDELGALSLMVTYQLPGVQEALAQFAQKWAHEDLVMDKWFGLQAARPGPDAIADVERLLQHPQFTLDVPNRARSVIGAFGGNAVAFHQENGEGYRVFFEQLRLIDARNPQLAARLATVTARLHRLPTTQQALLTKHLQQMLADGCSDNLREVLNRVLK